MGALTEKNVKELSLQLDELHTVKVIEETVHVEKPVFKEKIVEVPVFKDVTVERPVYVDKEIRTYTLKENSLAEAMQPVISEIKKLEAARADIVNIIASALDDAVKKAFSDMIKKLGK